MECAKKTTYEVNKLFLWFRNLNNAKQYIILMNGDTNLLSVMAFHGSEMNDGNLISTTIGI